jgi:fido (protein-threonine AMPylation protein)
MRNFDEYIRQGEPSQKEKALIWQTAIGLQDVDGLKPSDYLIETARENIEDKITINEVQQRIDSYYKEQSNQKNIDTERTEEADKVSARITEILSNNTFSFSPLEYIEIHRRLFTGIYKFAGKIRDYNITKNEWVLKGHTVLYSDFNLIRQTLDYDFAQEKQFDYKTINYFQSIQHIVKFISGIWQIHAFGEGNTRTTAVFAIKYLRSFGFEIDNNLFAEHSRYFRNALVRANFNDLKNSIYATTEYLMHFFGNLLLNENNILKNRELLVDWKNGQNFQSAKNE